MKLRASGIEKSFSTVVWKYRGFLGVKENGNQKTVFKTAVLSSKDERKKIINLNNEFNKKFIALDK